MLKHNSLLFFLLLKRLKELFFYCNPSKAPGPNGFSFQFYQSCWDFISSDIMQLVHVFHSNIFNLSRINLAFICLIPKKTYANTITQYRSISLINYSTKIITKLLTERMPPPLMNYLIAPTQTAYIKDRYIMNKYCLCP
jgi:hypothetical protein